MIVGGDRVVGYAHRDATVADVFAHVQHVEGRRRGWIVTVGDVTFGRPSSRLVWPLARRWAALRPETRPAVRAYRAPASLLSWWRLRHLRRRGPGFF